MGNRGGDQFYTAIQAGNKTANDLRKIPDFKLFMQQKVPNQRTAIKMMIIVMIKIQMQGANKQQHRILNDQFDGQ
jgi:hypothetical protein